VRTAKQGLTMKIERAFLQTFSLTGQIPESYNRKKIEEILGFAPDKMRDGKGKYCWMFLADGKPCAIWDWKDSKVWSCYGDEETLRKLFTGYRKVEF
jgi:hypothetical protein